VLDTGFHGFLTLPPAAVAALALPFLNDFIAALADGSRVRRQVHAATILWDGAERDREILATAERRCLARHYGMVTMSLFRSLTADSSQ
jgi:predicted aspartyl protease